MSGVYVTLRLDTSQAQSDLDRFVVDVEGVARKKIPIDLRGELPSGGSAPAVDSVERAVQRQGRRGGFLPKAIMASLRRRKAPLLRAAGVARRARTGTSMLRAGNIAAIGLVAGLTALRLASGQPLEGSGAAINRMILGDEDDKARATRRTREFLAGNDDIAGIVGRQNRGHVNQQIAGIAAFEQQRNEREERAGSAIREAFPVNGKLDMLILAFGAAMKTAWQSVGGPHWITDLHRNYQRNLEQYMTDARKVSSRG